MGYFSGGYSLSETGPETDLLLDEINKVFFCQYGVTEYADALTKYNAGKGLYAVYNKKTYLLTDYTNSTFYFAQLNRSLGYASLSLSASGWAVVDSVSVAPTDSPVFTGTPTAPTADPYTNNEQIATTAYVDNATISALMEDTITDAEIASFPDGAKDAPITELIVGIESTQNLNGQASPWPPGGGSNLLDPSKLSVNTSQPYGLNISYSNNTFRVYGTSSYAADYVAVVLMSYSDYSLSGKSYFVQYFDASGTGANLIRNAYGLRTDSENSVGMTFNFTNTQTIDVTFKLCVAATEQSAWSPYANICPIYSNAEKNILPLDLADIKAANTSGTWSGNDYTLNSVVFSVKTDGGSVVGITVDGTASADTTFKIAVMPVYAGDALIFSGCPPTGSQNTYVLYVENKPTSYFDYGNGVTWQIAADDNFSTAIYVKSGYAANNLEFYPMLRSAANPDPSYVPYRCVARVDEYGKNLLGEFVQGYLSTTDGKSASYNANWVYTPDYIKIDGGTTIRVSATQTNSSVLFTYDKNMNFLGAYQLMTNATVGGKTLDANVAFFRFSINIAGGSIPITPAEVPNYKFQLEIGTEATEYEAFKDRTYFVMGNDTSPTEIYGGELNVTTGELKVTHGQATLNGTQTLNPTGTPTGIRCSYTLPSSAKPTNNDAVADIITTQLVAISWTQLVTVGTKGIAISTSGAVASFAFNGLDTLEAVNSYLSSNPMDIVYELATPQIFHIDPVTIKTWLANNNIVCNTGKIKLVVYRCNTALYILKKTGA